MARVNSLEMTNLRCFGSARVELGQLNFIAGRNGSGKSTVKDALSLALSGTATGCETGQGLAGLRSAERPHDAWEIRALIAGRDGTPREISRTDSEGPRSQRQQLVESITSVRGSVARACIYSGELLRLDAKARARRSSSR